MQLMNNSAEPSGPPHIPFRYLGLLGDADSHVPVGLGGPLRRLAVPETVITLQVSNLETETRGTASESTSERAAGGLLEQLVNYGGACVLFKVESRHQPRTRTRLRVLRVPRVLRPK